MKKERSDELEITQLIIRGKSERVKKANKKLHNFLDKMDNKFKVKTIWVDNSKENLEVENE